MLSSASPPLCVCFLLCLQTESMFYGSRFVRANATMAEVLPQLADFLREANATAPAPAGSSADGGGATSAAATRPALAAWAAAALVPAALHLLLV